MSIHALLYQYVSILSVHDKNTSVTDLYRIVALNLKNETIILVKFKCVRFIYIKTFSGTITALLKSLWNYFIFRKARFSFQDMTTETRWQIT